MPEIKTHRRSLCIVGHIFMYDLYISFFYVDGKKSFEQIFKNQKSTI